MNHLSKRKGTSKFRAAFFLCFLSLTGSCALPVFTANQGQVRNELARQNAALKYLYCGNNGIKVQLRDKGYSYEIITAVNNVKPIGVRPGKTPSNILLKGCRVDVDFIEPSALMQILPLQPALSSTYWCDGINQFRLTECTGVLYKGVYPGIDIEFLLTGNENAPLKYNVILHAGANLKSLRFKVNGCNVYVKDQQLYYRTDLAEFSENIPLSYYKNGDLAKVNFELSGNIVGFNGEWNGKETLVIDPLANVVWSTYYGDSFYDVATGTGVDAADNVYISGYTMSNANIATSGTYQFTLSGGFDVYLTKFTKTGQRVWSTYYGGPASDAAYAMAVLPDGSSYLTGGTSSSVNISSAGAHQITYGGGINDIFLARFDANGQRLWSTYYGGSEHDIAQALAVDKQGNVFISGHTESPNNIATTGAYKTVYNFNFDVCLAKFNPAGVIQWGTYYGDSGIDETYAMATDTSGNVCITGGTESISDISTPGAFQFLNGGLLDIFVTKFSGNGSLVWGTYMGGQGGEAGYAMNIHRNGTIYVGGACNSTNNIASVGAYQTSPNSFDEAFLAAFTSSGQRLWSTYFGGDDVDYINDIEIGDKSEVWLCGATMSSLAISTSSAYQASLATIGYYDACFAKFSPAGIKEHCTYFGGEGNDRAWAMSFDNVGRLYLAGETTSTANISTALSHRPSNSGSTDAFLTKFCIPYTAKLFPASSYTACKGAITLSTSAGFSSYQWSNGVTTNPMVLNIFATGNYTYCVSVNDGLDCSAKSDTLRLHVSACLGIEENTNGILKAFPSPASVYLNLEVDDLLINNYSYEVYSGEGKRVGQGLLSGEKQINVSALAPGVYQVLLSSGAQVYRSRFIKE